MDAVRDAHAAGVLGDAAAAQLAADLGVMIGANTATEPMRGDIPRASAPDPMWWLGAFGGNDGPSETEASGPPEDPFSTDDSRQPGLGIGPRDLVSLDPDSKGDGDRRCRRHRRGPRTPLRRASLGNVVLGIQRGQRTRRRNRRAAGRPVAALGLPAGTRLPTRFANSTSCYISPTRTVLCLGLGSLGQLGDGRGVSSSTPVEVSGQPTNQSAYP